MVVVVRDVVDHDDANGDADAGKDDTLLQLFVAAWVAVTFLESVPVDCATTCSCG